ncbi:MAG: hypothetical protein OXE92_05535 [Bacteroidetes bacterium]|nr:hypothetical protein [Bacteroidota bacterium]MCY4205172.1 hypothetical protein [Bacteroidota bacterium]
MEDQPFSELSRLFREAGLDPDGANNLTERIINMASANVLDRIDTSYARLESKLDASNAQFGSELKTVSKTLESKIDVQNSKIDAQNSKYNTLIVILSLLAATGVLGFLANIFEW